MGHGPPDLPATLKREWRAVTPGASGTQLLGTAFASDRQEGCTHVPTQD